MIRRIVRRSSSPMHRQWALSSLSARPDPLDTMLQLRDAIHADLHRRHRARRPLNAFFEPPHSTTSGRLSNAAPAAPLPGPASEGTDQGDTMASSNGENNIYNKAEQPDPAQAQQQHPQQQQRPQQQQHAVPAEDVRSDLMRFHADVRARHRALASRLFGDDFLGGTSSATATTSSAPSPRSLLHDAFFAHHPAFAGFHAHAHGLGLGHGHGHGHFPLGGLGRHFLFDDAQWGMKRHLGMAPPLDGSADQPTHGNLDNLDSSNSSSSSGSDLRADAGTDAGTGTGMDATAASDPTGTATATNGAPEATDPADTAAAAAGPATPDHHRHHHQQQQQPSAPASASGPRVVSFRSRSTETYTREHGRVGATHAVWADSATGRPYERAVRQRRLGDRHVTERWGAPGGIEAGIGAGAGADGAVGGGVEARAEQEQAQAQDAGTTAAAESESASSMSDGQAGESESAGSVGAPASVGEDLTPAQASGTVMSPAEAAPTSGSEPFDVGDFEKEWNEITKEFPYVRQGKDLDRQGGDGEE